jgi:hypothetical protein
MPPSAASHRVPFSRYVPASAAAAVTNSPRAIAAQNTCTTSGTIRSENRAIHASVHPPSKRTSRAPGAPGRTARRSPRSARPRARLRDDRRATQPPSSDDLKSPSNWAGVAITARTQGSHLRRRLHRRASLRWEQSSRRDGPDADEGETAVAGKTEVAGCVLNDEPGASSGPSDLCVRWLRPDRGAGRSRLLSGACTSRVPDGCCFRDRAGSVSADRWRAGPGCASLASARCCLAWAGSGTGRGRRGGIVDGQRWTGALTVRFAHAGAAVARRRPRFPQRVDS